MNIMPVSVMKMLKRLKDELISSDIAMGSFVVARSQAKGVLPLEVMSRPNPRLSLNPRLGCESHFN